MTELFFIFILPITVCCYLNLTLVFSPSLSVVSRERRLRAAGALCSQQPSNEQQHVL